MIIYPAIDIIGGECVRLSQGSYSQVTVFSNSPVDMARKWEALGAQYLHVVDLDGARSGQSENQTVIGDICKALSIPVQVGGGIRSIETIEKLLALGVSRLILGTSAVQNQQLLKYALMNYPDKIAVGIDAKQGMVAISGWEETSNLNAIEFAKTVEALGAKTIIYTDIARDGMLSGPNLPAMTEMAKAVSIDVIASGGVSCLEDIKALRTTGVKGVIVGKALYTGAVDLVEALK